MIVKKNTDKNTEFSAFINERKIILRAVGPLTSEPGEYPDAELGYDGMYKLIFLYEDSGIEFLHIAAFFSYTDYNEKMLVMVTIDNPGLEGKDEFSGRRQIQLLDRIMEYPDSIPFFPEKSQREFLDTIARLYIDAIEKIFVFA
jgi:hypothetical protein